MAGYAKPKVLGQHQQPVMGDQPRRVKVKAHHRTVKPRAPKPFDPLAQPITPGSSITVRQARRMASAATKVRYGGQETDLQQQLQAAQQLQSDKAGWYRMYLDQLAKYQQNVKDAGVAANAQALGLQQGITGLDQANANQQQQQMSTDAASRGASVSPQLAQDANNATAVRQALAGGLGALIAARAGSANDFAANQAHVVGPQQQLQAMAQGLGEQNKIRGAQNSLKGQEGAYAQSFIDNLSGQEAKNLLALSIASGKDLTQRASIKERVRHDKASEHNTRRGINARNNSPSAQKTKADLAFFKKHGYYPTHGKPGQGTAKKPTAGPGSLTSGQENHIVQQVKGARAAAASLMSQPGAKSSEVRQLLAAGKVDGIKYPHDVINAAFDLLPTKYGGLGGLSRANVKALHHMGVHVQGVFPLVFGGAKSAPATAVQQTSSGVFGF